MTPRTLIPWADLEALGGRQEGDPLYCSECDLCPCREYPGSAPDGGGDCGRDYAAEPHCPALLPESGALALRVLWRHRRTRALGAIDVPRMTMLAVNYGWALVMGGAFEAFGHAYNHISDPLEALAAIVHDEAEKARGQR